MRERIIILLLINFVGWSNHPTFSVNLFSKEKLSTEIFQTDTLELKTEKESSAQNLKKTDIPRVFLLDPDNLVKIKQRITAGDKTLLPSLKKLRHEASQALKAGPFSVMNKPFTPPSGDKHDYMSLAPYWWPDPDSKNGLPYIRKDGVVNPERNLYDKKPLREMDLCVTTLALAYYFTEHEPYAEHAAQLVRGWFLDEKTRMNPNLNYGQAVPGISEGRGSGIIDARSFFRIADAVGLIENSSAWQGKDQLKLQMWLEKFLYWLVNSDYGKDESKHKNNHGTWYDVTASHLALFVGKKDIAREILSTVPTRRIAVQIEPDGRQLHELKRTRAFHYSAMNIEGLFYTALLGEKVGLDIWNFTTKDGRNMKTALEFLIPFAIQKKKWQYKQIGGWEIDLELMFFLLRLASIKYNNPEYEKFIDQLPGIDTKTSRVNLLF